SFVSLYYYLIIIKEMFLGEPEEAVSFPVPWLEYGALSLLVIGVLFIGLYPAPLFDQIDTSTATIFRDSLVAVSGR
ncbi:MAG: hypothetical protein ACREUU_20310, partial [Gammaproteobacteria bacterium]